MAVHNVMSSILLSFCLDENQCKTNRCGRNENCEISVAGYKCTCKNAFIRKNGACVPITGKLAYFSLDFILYCKY